MSPRPQLAACLCSATLIAAGWTLALEPAGIGFVVDASVDDLLRGRDALNLVLRSRDDEPPRTLTARVLHRATRSGSVYYGCTFAA